MTLYIFDKEEISKHDKPDVLQHRPCTRYRVTYRVHNMSAHGKFSRCSYIFCGTILARDSIIC